MARVRHGVRSHTERVCSSTIKLRPGTYCSSKSSVDDKELGMLGKQRLWKWQMRSKGKNKSQMNNGRRAWIVPRTSVKVTMGSFPPLLRHLGGIPEGIGWA